jgi:tyrosine-protein kinase
MVSSNEILGVLWKRRRTFAIVFVITFGIAVTLTFVLPKAYSTSAYLIVASPKNAPSDFEATQSTALVAKTYADLVETDAFAEQVDARLPFTSGGTVKVDDLTDSKLIEVRATDDTPAHARLRANVYAQAVVERAAVLSSRSRSSQLSLAQAAPLPDQPSRPQPKLYLALGAVLAFFVAVAMALLRDRMDQRLDISAATTEVLGLPVLARVPRVPASRLPSRSNGSDEGKIPAAVAESYRLLLANLSFANLGKRPRTLAIVSASVGEGKSTTCVSLGRAAAEIGLDTAIIDADLRRPSLRTMVSSDLGEGQRGLSTLLVDPDAGTLEDIAALAAGVPLRMVPSGPVPPNPAALLGSEGLKELEQEARNAFDLTIFDTPPIAVGADASLVASRVDGVVFVLDARQTRRSGAVQAIDQLRRSHANILGVMLNRVADSHSAPYYHEAPQRRLRGRERRKAGTRV